MKRRLLVLVTIATACALLTVFGLVASAVFANRATRQFFDRDYRLKRSYQNILVKYKKSHHGMDPKESSVRKLTTLAKSSIFIKERIPWTPEQPLFASKYDPPEAFRNQGIANICGVLGILGLAVLVVCVFLIFRARKNRDAEEDGESSTSNAYRDSTSKVGLDKLGEGRASAGRWRNVADTLKRALVVPQVAFVMTGLIFGMLMLVINPPFHASDENAHYAKAFCVSEGNMLSVVRGGTLGLDIPDSFGLIQERTGFWPRRSVAFLPVEQPKATVSEITSSLNVPLGSEHKSFGNFAPWGSSIASPVSYLPQALGMALGRLFHLSALMLLYLGRLTNLLFFLLLVFIAIRLTPVLKWTFFLLALMPLTINLVASLSYDGPIISLSFLFVAYVLYLALEERKQQVTRRDLYGLFALAVLLALAKNPYFLLVVFFLAVPSDRFRSKKEYYSVFALLLVVIIVVAGAWILIVGTASALPSQSNNILKHPVKFVTTVLRTLNLNKLFWTHGFVGMLGWAEVWLPLWFAFTYIFFIIAIAALDKDDIAVRSRQKVIASGALLVVFLAIFAIFYLSSTYLPHGATTVSGITSRYFICIAPLFFLLFCNTKIRYNKDRWFYVTILGFSVFSMALTMIKLVSRYYY